MRSVRYRILKSYKDTPHGPSGATRTPGLLNPNQARYHLRYTRIFSFCYYTTPRAKIKDFPVCGQSCGQSRFSARFGDPAKSRKRPCRKAFQASAFLVVDGAGATPKAGALPTALHPVISLFYPAGRILPTRRPTNWDTPIVMFGIIQDFSRKCNPILHFLFVNCAIGHKTQEKILFLRAICLDIRRICI